MEKLQKYHQELRLISSPVALHFIGTSTFYCIEIIQYFLLLPSALLLCKSSIPLSGRGKLATTKQLSVRDIHIQILPFSFPTLKILVQIQHSEPGFEGLG